MADLEGQMAVVTGASSGIGRAAVRLLAAEGARVTFVARRAGVLRGVAEELISQGSDATYHPSL